MRASEVPTMSVEALIPYARNSRTHSEDQVAQIAASIREFGFTNPVLVDGKGGIIAVNQQTGTVQIDQKYDVSTVLELSLLPIPATESDRYLVHGDQADGVVLQRIGDLVQVYLSAKDAGASYTIALTSEGVSGLIKVCSHLFNEMERFQNYSEKTA